MTDNQRLIIEGSVSDESDVSSISNNPQSLDAVKPAAVEMTTIDGSLVLDSNVKDITDSLSGDTDTLVVDCTVPSAVLEIQADVTDALRLSSSRSVATGIDGMDDREFVMLSSIRTADDYETIVDMLGQPEPPVFYLLREGGSGFITYENGNRVLIL